MAKKMANDVFISYRRVTSSDTARLLHKSLQEKMPKSSFFFDVNTIPPGEDFIRLIEDNIRTVKVLLVIIDKNWLELTDDEGNRRLDSSKDYIRREIEAAFKCDITVIPVLVNDVSMPKENMLPESLRRLCRCNAYLIRHEHYDRDVNELSSLIKGYLPSKFFSIFDSFVGSKKITNFVFTYSIFTALLLFFGVMLGLGSMDYTLNIFTNFAGDDENGLPIKREVGFLLAVNWTIAMLFITPLLINLFHSVMHDAKSLLQDMQVHKMIVYITASGEEDHLPSSSVWSVVLQTSITWFFCFFILALILSLTQWYMYSGSFYFYGDTVENIARILYQSTGVDWNVGWVVSEGLDARRVVTFTLTMYLTYGIGWWLTFSFYIFLFNFFSEIENMSGATRMHSTKKLRLDLEDAETGGFGMFYQIQRHHSFFCILSIMSMFLMSFRNTYLQNICKVPESVSKTLNKDILLNQCDSMTGLAGRLIESLTAICYSPAEILNILFFSYAKASNPFVIGSFLQVGVIAGFFYFITIKMEGIINAARRTSNNNLAASSLLNQLKHQHLITLMFLITGGIATIFLNFVIVPLLLLFVLMVSDYLRFNHRIK